MQPTVWIPLGACLLAGMIASALLSHDPGQRANRIVAAMLVCSGWWSLCEVLWSLQADPAGALWLIRLSSLGWMLCGPLSIELFAELAGDGRPALRRWLRGAYGLTGLVIALYVATPWGLAEAQPTSWGWSFRFGPLFPFCYAWTLAQLLAALSYAPRLFAGAAAGERRQAIWLLVGFAIPLTAASLTDAVLPYLGVHVPRIGSTSLLALGAVAAWSVHRHGYFVAAPGAFTHEILDALRDGVALVHPDGRIRTCNDGLAKLVGLPREQLGGTSLREFVPELHAAGTDALEALELELRPETGERIPIEVSSSPLYDQEGAAVGQVLALRDMREVASLRNRLVTSGRLAAVGELAAGIAHEIANPISFVRANLDQLRRHAEMLHQAAESAARPALDDLLAEVGELLEESVEGVERVASIVRDVGAFSHAGLGRSQLAQINELIDNALSVAVLSFSVVVERCYGEIPPVSCDPQQLKQVFLNLLLNALQAVGDYGRIRLVTQSVGGWVVVRVEDDGPGIAGDAIDRVFDPFFTTRPTGEGLGLGLAHCYQVVRSHGGEIGVVSTPGRGASFEVRLPAAD